MDETEAPLDPSTRRLCPDGSCVGILGEDGRCKECGRSADGALADIGEDGRDDVGQPPAEPGKTEGGFDPSRRLCPDGACIGVLGADGVCPVCGNKSE